MLQFDYRKSTLTGLAMLTHTEFKEQTRLEELQSYLARHALQFATAKDGSVVGLVNMLTFEEEAIVDRLAALSDITHFAKFWESHRQWLIGDAVNMGLNEAGEIFASHLSDTTIANWVGVCSRYTHAERVGGLSFTHHSETAYIADKRQRAALLQRALDENLTAAELRALKNADAKPDAYIVRGMQRYPIYDATRWGLINEDEYTKAKAAGKKTARVEYVVTFED